MADHVKYKLNEELMLAFGTKIEKAVNKIIKDNSTIDTRLELLIIFLSFAEQVAEDLNIPREDYFNLIESIKEEIDSEEEPVTLKAVKLSKKEMN